jgi:hypothetical protein
MDVLEEGNGTLWKMGRTHWKLQQANYGVGNLKKISWKWVVGK